MIKEITGRWLCIWPDGSRSIVFDCYSVEDAIQVLDEIGAAEPHMLHVLDAVPGVIDFKREKDGRYVNHEFFMLSESLDEQAHEKIKPRKAVPVKPVSDKAVELALLLDMSMTLANKYAEKS